jgi:hypothetical protein
MTTTKKPAQPKTQQAQAKPAGLLSIRAYAEHRRGLRLSGCVSSAVQLALRSGRIHRTCPDHPVCPATCHKGGFDPHAADLDWQAWTDSDHQRAESRFRQVMDYRSRNDKARCELNEIKLLQVTGELVPKSEVYAEEFRRFRKVRDAFLPIPRRIAGRLAAETDRDQVERLLTEAIRAALDKVAQAKPMTNAEPAI